MASKGQSAATAAATTTALTTENERLQTLVDALRYELDKLRTSTADHNPARYIIGLVKEGTKSLLYPQNVVIHVMRCVVVIHCPSQYSADYQLGRLRSGMATGSHKVHNNFDEAIKDAEAMNERLQDDYISRGRYVPQWDKLTG